MELMYIDELLVTGGVRTTGANPHRPPVECGSPAAILIEWASDIRQIQKVPTTLALVKRGTPTPRAKRATDTMLEHRRAFILVPKLDSIDALAAELAAHGVRASRIPDADIDVKAMRERLDLTQEQFALHYGLDLDAIRNWEHGRRKPDTAARSYLRAIYNDPAAVEAALWLRPETPSGD